MECLGCKKEIQVLLRNRYQFCDDCGKNANNRIKIYRQMSIDEKGGKCEICGYNRCIASLEFHHRDPSEKEYAWRDLGSCSLETIKKEMGKCILLCSNCHKEIHYLNKDEFKQRIQRKPRSRTCIVCEKVFEKSVWNPRRKYCSLECSKMGNRKVRNRPVGDELKLLLDTMPLTKIGEKYGVTGNAVKKWAKRDGLIDISPKKEI